MRQKGIKRRKKRETEKSRWEELRRRAHGLLPPTLTFVLLVRGAVAWAFLQTSRITEIMTREDEGHGGEKV